ncbi:uncharacterized protein N7496_004497 [Penicillium cataractarum]|uniref:Potassium channel domain-containing protein n=1 Tax=Penicillium cataractarum TaxID=2100454 RepID=A0A9W9SRB9_9EURO|nr:uncharacterized protein N7496_004497 [Penicillium cataractarum]KAJ5382069.1 hypothetical protein N7496_004497 [Penicillium cataractarum]
MLTNTDHRTTGLKTTSLVVSAGADAVYLLFMVLHLDSLKGYMVTVCGWLVSAVILFNLIGIETQQHQQAQANTNQHSIYTESFYACIIAAGLYTLSAILLAVYMLSAKAKTFTSADRRLIECTSIVFRVNIFVIFLLGGAAIYSSIEGWSLIDALYFTDYTLLTIGIGNLTPQTHLGRSLLFPYATSGIVSLGLVITSMTSFISRIRDMKLRHIIQTARQGFSSAAVLENEPLEIRFPKWTEIMELHTIKSDFYRRRRWAELGLSLIAWFLLWFLSAAIFRQSETQDDWTYFVALYFTFTSLTTIGYGDYYPQSNFGRVFFVFWSLLALPILTNLVSVMGDVFHTWLKYISSHVWRHLFYKCRTREPHEHECTRHSYITSNVPSGLGCTEHTQVKSRMVSIQFQLQLAQEIQSLLSAMTDESLEHKEKICCTWSRIIPLLHAGEYNASCSSERTPFVPPKSENEMMTKFMDPLKEPADRNAEISWMLTLLVEKLCLDLRNELSEIM